MHLINKRKTDGMHIKPINVISEQRVKINRAQQKSIAADDEKQALDAG